MLTRIICIGNSFHQRDSGGPQVYEILLETQLPGAVELIDGGVGGLTLLGLLENVDHVIFVDSVEGFLSDGGILIVEDPAAELELQAAYDHNSGLAYLLHSATVALDCPMPKIYLVGVEGKITPELCQEAAQKCLQLARKLDRAQIPAGQDSI